MLASYPFQPQGLVRLFYFFVVLGAVGVVLMVLIGLNRDDVLSRIEKTEPGKVTWSLRFILNVGVFAALPLMTLIASESPGISSFLFSWLSPALRALVH